MAMNALDGPAILNRPSIFTPTRLASSTDSHQNTQVSLRSSALKASLPDRWVKLGAHDDIPPPIVPLVQPAKDPSGRGEPSTRTPLPRPGLSLKTNELFVAPPGSTPTTPTNHQPVNPYYRVYPPHRLIFNEGKLQDTTILEKDQKLILPTLRWMHQVLARTTKCLGPKAHDHQQVSVAVFEYLFCENAGPPFQQMLNALVKEQFPPLTKALLEKDPHAFQKSLIVLLPDVRGDGDMGSTTGPAEYNLQKEFVNRRVVTQSFAHYAPNTERAKGFPVSMLVVRYLSPTDRQLPGVRDSRANELQELWPEDPTKTDSTSLSVPLIPLERTDAPHNALPKPKGWKTSKLASFIRTLTLGFWPPA